MKIGYPAVPFILAVIGAHGSRCKTKHFLRSSKNGLEVDSATTTRWDLSDESTVMNQDKNIETRVNELNKTPLGIDFERSTMGYRD